MKRALPWAALAVLALAAWFRLHDLSRWPLDGDEVYSYYDVRDVLTGAPWPEGVRSHPLGYLGMAATVRLFGAGEGPLRLFAALASLGAVAALLFMRREAVPRSAALLAGLLAALSPWLVYHAQEARFYGALLLFATLATLFALPGPGRRPWLAGLMCVLAVLCHPSALPLGACLALPLLLRLSRARILLIVAGALAVAVLWLASGGGAAWDTILEALQRRALTGYDAAHFVAGVGYNVGPGTLLLAAVASVIAVRRRAPDRQQLLAAAWLPGAVLLLAALTGASVQQRYLMASVPALLLLAGIGLAALAASRVAWVAGAALALLPPVPALYDYTRGGDRSDLRGAAAWLSAHADPEDNIVADESALLDLYLRRELRFSDNHLHEAPVSEQKLYSLPRHARDCWVVVKSSRMQGAYGEVFTQWLEQNFIERARIGPPPSSSLVRHDNRLLIFQRRERLPP